MQDHSLSHLSSIRLKKARLIKRLGIFSIVFVIAAFSMVYVWQRVQVIKVGYQIEALKKEKAGLLRENKDLQIESSTLTSPDRIESIADTDIGMRVPASGQIVLVEKIKAGRPAPGAARPVLSDADRAATAKAMPGKT
ncbi:MAG: cell division protein FtsL [Nitrospirota bacterium]